MYDYLNNYWVDIIYLVNNPDGIEIAIENDPQDEELHA